MSIKSSIDDLIRTFYNRRSDSTLDKRIYHDATTVKDFYIGYPHVIRWDNTVDNYQNAERAKIWCRENCVGLYTTHIHRVYINKWTNEWEFNEIGSGDYCFWAFEKEEDAVMFALTW